MVTLSPGTLRAAVEVCRSTPDVSIGIVVDTMSSARAACRDTAREPGVSGATRTCVTFSTGSRIRYIPLSENIRGHRFDYVLIHSLIDNDENRSRLRYLERPAFTHYDTRMAADTFILNERAEVIIDEFNSINTGYFIKFENGSIIRPIFEVEDLGEFQVSNAIIEYICGL